MIQVDINNSAIILYMSIVKQAFQLLNNFNAIKPKEQQRRIKKTNLMLKRAEKKQKTALLALWEIDQLRKQRAYMLLTHDDSDEGLGDIQSLVDEYDEKISRLHEEAAFQLSEAAIASFRRKKSEVGKAFAISALKHAGQAKFVSSTFINAVELLLQQQKGANK